MNIEINFIERSICMDEVDLECSHCAGLTAYRSCSQAETIVHCVHCGNPLIAEKSKSHKVDKKAKVPRKAI